MLIDARWQRHLLAALHLESLLKLGTRKAWQMMDEAR
jgi:hypothetical protein